MSEQWLCKKGCKAHMMADIPGNGKDGIYYAVCSPSRPLKGFIVSDSPYMFGSECCSRCFWHSWNRFQRMGRVSMVCLRTMISFHE